MAVNFSGMCWTMTIPRQVAGNWVSTASRACVPPVEVPMATTWSVVRTRALLPAALSITSAFSFGLTAAGIPTALEVLRTARILARAALRTACTMSLEASSRKLFSPSLGLVIIEMAPADRASKVACAPSSAREEQITTGVGCSAMIFLRKVMPSMRGISMSITSTSGHCNLIFCIAKIGSEAAPMTSMSGSVPSAWETTCRTRAESSTIKTLILSAIGTPDMSIESLREGQPGISAPEIEVELSSSAATDVLGDQSNMPGSQPLASVFDVAQTNLQLAAGRATQHVTATEEFRLVFTGGSSSGVNLLQEKFRCLAAKAAIERRVGRTPTFGKQVVAHAADSSARVPKCDRNTRTEQG